MKQGDTYEIEIPTFLDFYKVKTYIINTKGNGRMSIVLTGNTEIID